MKNIVIYFDYTNRLIAICIFTIFIFSKTSLLAQKKIVIDPYLSLNESLEEIIEDIDYQHLEDTEGKIFEKAPTVKVTSTRYYIYDKTYLFSPILAFDKSGNFLFEIYKKGKGPGEYLRTSDVYVNEETNKLEVVDLEIRKIITYSLDGKYIREKYLDYMAFEFGYIGENYLVSHCSYSPSRYNSKLIVESLKDGTKNGYFKINPDQYPLIIESGSALNQNDEYSYSYIPTLEYTMYRVDSSGIEAKYFFDFGKYQIPDEMFGKNLRIDQFLKKIESNEYVSMLSGLETQGYIVLVFSHNEKRVAFYSKYKDRLYYARDWESSGIALGIKGSITSDNEDILYMVVPAYQMLEMAKRVAQIPDKEQNIFHQKLLDVAKKLSEDSNPVIAKITLKSQ